MADEDLDFQEAAAPTHSFDVESNVGGTATRIRERVQLAGAGTTRAEVATVKNTDPGTSAYGLTTRVPDGGSVALGATADADTALTVVGRLKKLLTLLPAALVSGRLDVNIGASPATLPVDMTDDAARVLGLLAANSGVDIGDVDVTSVIPGSGATNLGKAIDAVAGATDTGVAPLALRDDALSALTPAEGDWAPLRTNSRGALWTIHDGTLVVDGSGVTQPVSAAALPLPTGAATEASLAAAAASLAILDDWDESDRAKVNPIAGQAGVQGGSGAVSALTQRVVLATDVALPAGANAIGKLAANSGVDIGDVDVLTLPGITGTVAHDAADSGNPVKIGGKARTADPAAVAADDRADLYMDTLGKPVVLLGAPHDLHVNGTATYTNTTAADVIAAVASNRIAVTSILVTNAHATVGTKVEIRDGATVKIQGQAAAAGGGFSLNGGGRPLFIGASGAAITARNVTTGADVDVSIGGYKIVN